MDVRKEGKNPTKKFHPTWRWRTHVCSCLGARRWHVGPTGKNSRLLIWWPPITPDLIWTINWTGWLAWQARSWCAAGTMVGMLGIFHEFHPFDLTQIFTFLNFTIPLIGDFHTIMEFVVITDQKQPCPLLNKWPPTYFTPMFLQIRSHHQMWYAHVIEANRAFLLEHIVPNVVKVAWEQLDCRDIFRSQFLTNDWTAFRWGPCWVGVCFFL